ncbi:MAG: hypothetical protein FWC10_00800 [Lentimicrobiaceae bacterium]|nr:hypothetical protein [Lentimicrobiaceae bacterium]
MKTITFTDAFFQRIYKDDGTCVTNPSFYLLVVPTFIFLMIFALWFYDRPFDSLVFWVIMVFIWGLLNLTRSTKFEGNNALFKNETNVTNNIDNSITKINSDNHIEDNRDYSKHNSDNHLEEYNDYSKHDNSTVNHTAPIIEEKPAVDSKDLSSRNSGTKKIETEVEKIDIPLKLFNALKNAGYAVRSEQKYKGKFKCKWIKTATKTKEIHKTSLFEFCELMGWFKDMNTTQKVAFVSENFELDSLSSSNFGRHNNPKHQSEFYNDLENMVKKYVSV